VSRGFSAVSEFLLTHNKIDRLNVTSRCKCLLYFVYFIHFVAYVVLFLLHVLTLKMLNKDSRSRGVSSCEFLLIGILISINGVVCLYVF